MAILEVNSLKKCFGSLQVLKGIDFSLEQGESLAVIGSSGSGKTTLLRCLNFLELADGGSISVGGEVIFDSVNPSSYSDSRGPKEAPAFRAGVPVLQPVFPSIQPSGTWR